MPGTVNIPGMGPVSKGKAAAVGVGVVGLAYLWYRHQANAATAAQAAMPTPPDAGTDTQDVAAGGGVDGTYDSYGGAAGSAGYSTLGTSQSYFTTPTTNADWTLQAEQNLQAVGFDPIASSIALGKYLARQPLTAAEAEMVQTAVSMVGTPPIGVFEISTTPSGTTVTGTTPAGGGPTHKYVTTYAKVGQLNGPPVSSRAEIKYKSDSAVATDNNVQVALARTFVDPRNALTTAYAKSHGGNWKGGAGVYLTVVKVA